MLARLTPGFVTRPFVGRWARFAVFLALVGNSLTLVVFRLRQELPGDFGSLWVSGWAAANGLGPYAVYPLTGGHPIDGVFRPLPNINPPASLFFLRLLAPFDPRACYLVWALVSALCFVAAVLLLARAYPDRVAWLFLVWLFALPGLWQTLWDGQLYMPLVLGAALSWISLRSGAPIRAGLCLAPLLIFKPTFAVVPLILLVAGHARVGLAALGLSGLVSAAALAYFGWDVHLAWWAVASIETCGCVVDTLTTLGLPWLGHALVGLAGALLLLWTRRARPEPPRAVAVALAFYLSFLPWTSTGYVLFLLPVFFWWVWRPVGLLAAGLLVLPPKILSLLDWATDLPPGALNSAYTLACWLVLGLLLASPGPDCPASRCHSTVAGEVAAG